MRHTIMQIPHRPHLVFLPAVLIALGPLTGCAHAARADDGDGRWTSAAYDETTGSAPSGRVVKMRGNVRGFNPEETTAGAGLEAFNFKLIFEELGEDAALWYQHVQALASPYFEGRLDGTEGSLRARDYMEFFYRTYGLEPAFPDPAADSDARVSYRQPFTFNSGWHIEVTADDEYASVDGAALIPGEDFAILGNSGSGDAIGPLAFVGYGVADGPDDYSSFDDDTDLTDRIALLLRYEPLDDEGKSRWTNRRFSARAGLARKMNAVQERGAAGIILVTPPGAVDGSHGLETLESSAQFGSSMEVPIIQITPEVAERILAGTDPEGRSLTDWRKLADENAVTTVNLDDSTIVAMGGAVARERARQRVAAANVGAALPGRGALADEWLVIGGHYDHHGYQFNSTNPADGPLMPGADDNASGTAGVLVLAKMLSEAYAEVDDDADLRSVMFLNFDAEERGLHGSRNFTKEPGIDPERITAMINMDMIGRLRSDELAVFGTGTAEGLPGLLNGHFERSGLTVNASARGGGGSDHASFLNIDVPAIFFFTGVHDLYTTPGDQAWTVNPVGAAKVLDLVYAVSMDLATRDDKLVFTRPEADSGQDRGYGRVRLGIRPDTTAELETGIRVEDVSTGTSAADAGIQAGDIMLAWDGQPLETMRDLVRHLRTHEPGDIVIISIKRGEDAMDLRVKLKESTGRRRGG